MTRLVYNSVIGVYSATVAVIWVIAVMVSLLLFPMNRWLMDFVYRVLSKLPEPEFIPKPEEKS